MFKNTPFESVAKALSEGAPKFDPAATQAAVKALQDNLTAWGNLAQSQAQAVQASVTKTMASLQGVTDPKSAMEAMKSSAADGASLATQNLQGVTALAMTQFLASVDAIEKAHPMPESFASVAQALRAAANTFENAVSTALDKASATVVDAKPAAKKTR
jgi:chromosome segregation ATPase